ncbi:Tetracycline resistance element mobilization regulatory protein rteC [uncultured Dysgonomonas sp.]|uniref:Tetracycline resistance element mobilization regulatory protein rteC n=1 Tax=uncultured Dysgonomonas sp. TaxID=206096 RepID=A0A212KFH1_9BACT|nr:RteC domain-containing protein [uncultured Dysgonomonas sp.]SBW10466.1 Tetracycline resistance element mobilization regulatory protein rteC [uncultured Dysgonomonas sp.]
MIQFTEKLRLEIDRALLDIDRREADVLKKAKEVTFLLENAFDRLRTFILDYEFKDEGEEILFFKEIKPNLFSNLIYYSKVYDIEINRPTGGGTEVKDYLEKELYRIKDFFDRNKTIYCYYRSGDTEKDRLFFLRGKSDSTIYRESFSFERDPKFSTCCDYKMAKIIANEKVEAFIAGQLESQGGPSDKAVPKAKLTWTIKKVFLIELIYLLYWAGAFNYGKATLKEIAVYFEKVFNIDLGTSLSRTLTDIRARKGSGSFLNLLDRIFIKKINENEE